MRILATRQKILKRNQTDILELKNIIELKNSLEVFNSKFAQSKVRISELRDKSFLIIQSEEQKNNNNNVKE